MLRSVPFLKSRLVVRAPLKFQGTYGAHLAVLAQMGSYWEDGPAYWTVEDYQRAKAEVLAYKF
jgi:hypothetical protein